MSLARPMILALCLAAPAHAQDAAVWGGTGCVLRLVDDPGVIAEATCHNAVTSGNSHDEGSMRAGDLIVGLTVQHMPGEVPDVFTVIPPDGLVAVPGVISLDEKTDGVVMIMEWAGM